MRPPNWPARRPRSFSSTSTECLIVGTSTAAASKLSGEPERMLRDVPAVLRALKESFRRTFAHLPHQERPRSIFLIGSTALGQESSTNWYQDVDIHLFFDRELITLGQLLF